MGCVVHLGKAERGCGFGAAKHKFSMIAQQVLDSFLTEKAVCFPTGSKVISREVTSVTVWIYKGFLLRSSVTSAVGSFEWWVSFLLWEMSPLQDFLLSAFFPFEITFPSVSPFAFPLAHIGNDLNNAFYFLYTLQNSYMIKSLICVSVLENRPSE